MHEPEGGQYTGCICYTLEVCVRCRCDKGRSGPKVPSDLEEEQVQPDAVCSSSEDSFRCRFCADASDKNGPSTCSVEQVFTSTGKSLQSCMRGGDNSRLCSTACSCRCTDRELTLPCAGSEMPLLSCSSCYCLRRHLFYLYTRHDCICDSHLRSPFVRFCCAG